MTIAINRVMVVCVFTAKEGRGRAGCAILDHVLKCLLRLQ